MNDLANTQQPAKNLKAFWLDGLFWLAMLAGPLCWCALWLVGIRLREFGEPGNLFKELLWIALIYPVLEEIVFRGGIQSALRTRASLCRQLGGISIANLLTSLLFAAMHLLNQPPLWAAMILVPSLVFGWAAERYNNLLAPILLHMFYNAGFVLLFYGQ